MSDYHVRVVGIPVVKEKYSGQCLLTSGVQLKSVFHILNICKNSLFSFPSFKLIIYFSQIMVMCYFTHEMVM